MRVPFVPLAVPPLLQLLLHLLLSPARASSISAHEEEAAAATEQRPKMFVDYLNGPLKGDVQYFAVPASTMGNVTVADNLKLMEVDGNFLLVGAINAVHFIDTRSMEEAKELRIVWFPSAQDTEMCSVKGKSKDECQNHVRIVAHLPAKKLLLVCGTHAFRPKCREYKFQNGHYVKEKEYEGVGIVPYDPYHNSSFVVADGELYSATVSDFSGSDPLIYKEPLRTDQSDSKHLNSPDFVRGLSDEEYVYFFFREQAVEYINCGKAVYSRVARICKSDRGGPNKYKRSWSTYLKSRLNCSLPGEYPFYFDHLQATSEIISGVYGGQDNRLVYAVFTTPKNSISASALCAFRLRDLLDTFEGAFKEQETANSNWLPVAKIKEPSPRPGRCSSDSKALPETTLSFVKGHSIMDEAVPAFFGGKPLFTRASLLHPIQFGEIAVHGQVATPDGQAYDVLFVGTTDGRVLKIVNTADPSNHRASGQNRPTLVEEIVIFKPGTKVQKMLVVRNSMESEPKLAILTPSAVSAIPLSRCDAVATCARCVALQDPYCAWDVRREVCASLHAVAKMDSTNYLQNVLTGRHISCAEDDLRQTEFTTHLRKVEVKPASNVLVSLTSEEMDDAVNVNLGRGIDDTFTVHHHPVPDSHYSTEELSMAVATSCVCALVLGFLSGFLLARRCTCGDRGGIGRDLPPGDENPYHVPYLNQSGYNDDNIYAKVDDMTYYPVNNTLATSLPNTNSTTSTTREGGGIGTPSAGGFFPNQQQAHHHTTTGSKNINLHQAGHTTLSRASDMTSVAASINPKPSDFSAFGTVHRSSKKIYL